MCREMLSRVPLSIFVALIIGAGCDQREIPADASGTPELLQSAAEDRPDTGVIVSNQRTLLDALVNRSDDVQKHITMNFTLIDHADTVSGRSRDLRGNQVLGHDYFRALSGRLLPAHAIVEQTELFWKDPESVIVVTTHPTVTPTVTAWERVNGVWVAMRMQFNTPLERVAELRAHFAPAGPRAAS